MRWDTLLNCERLNDEKPHLNQDRSEFQEDYDDIVFCSAFRRLQDKAQVFALSGSDYVRTRLTHSLEVSCMGRALGNMVANFRRRKVPSGLRRGVLFTQT
jgi:dGTPase